MVLIEIARVQLSRTTRLLREALAEICRDAAAVLTCLREVRGGRGEGDDR